MLWNTEKSNVGSWGMVELYDSTDEIPRKMSGILLKVKVEPSRQND